MSQHVLPQCLVEAELDIINDLCGQYAILYLGSIAKRKL